MAGLWSRAVSLREKVRGSGPTPLEADLRRVTDCELLSSPADAIASIVAATDDADSRRTIMSHLRQCLSESEGRQWRRVYQALAIVEGLLQSDARGVKDLVAEAAEGRHFDMSFRLSFLEKFEYSVDLRVQGLVRERASSLKSRLLKMMDAAAMASEEEAAASAQSAPRAGGDDLLGFVDPSQSEPVARSSNKPEEWRTPRSEANKTPRSEARTPRSEARTPRSEARTPRDDSDYCTGDEGADTRSTEGNAGDQHAPVQAMSLRERATEQLKQLAPTPATPLELDLRRVTDSELLSSPDDALRSIARATADADNRNTIMTHLRQSLSEDSGKNWRRVYGALAIVEELLQTDTDGVRELVAETCEGRHFDMNFRLTFLESFEYDVDLRVQGLVRQRAASLRPKLLKMMETETSKDAPVEGPVVTPDAAVSAVSASCADLLGGDEPALGPAAAASVQPGASCADLLGGDEPVLGPVASASGQFGDLDLLGFDTSSPVASAEVTAAKPELSLLMDFEPSFVVTAPEIKKVAGSDSEGATSTDSTTATAPAPMFDLLEF